MNNEPNRSPRGLYLVLIWCLLLATPAVSDEVREYGAVTVTIHDEPRLDLVAKARPAPQRKLSVPGDWLVLPHFEADVTGTSGLNTFFAVRNLTTTARDITLRYQTNTGSPVDQFITLVAHQTRSFSIADIPTNSCGMASTARDPPERLLAA